MQKGFINVCRISHAMEKFNLNKVSEELIGVWSPKDVETINNFVLRVAKFDGEYHWHKHDNTDELFLVFKGRINIQTRSGDIVLEEGEGVRIPKGVEHCPLALEPSVVLMFEPDDLRSAGD